MPTTFSSLSLSLSLPPIHMYMHVHMCTAASCCLLAVPMHMLLMTVPIFTLSASPRNARREKFSRTLHLWADFRGCVTLQKQIFACRYENLF